MRVVEERSEELPAPVMVVPVEVKPSEEDRRRDIEKQRRRELCELQGPPFRLIKKRLFFEG